jgi:hypothetical protein
MRRPVLLVILLPLFSHVHPLHQTPASEAGRLIAELKQLEGRILEAEVAQDQQFFRDLELCGYRFIGWQGEQLTRAEDVAAVGEPRRGRILASGVDELAVKLYGASAVVWGLDTLVIQEPASAPRVSRSRFTHVYVLQDGGWRLVAGHVSPVARR